MLISLLILSGTLVAIGDLQIALLVIGIVLVLITISLIFPKVKMEFIMNINIMLTMLIGGLWHGASWKFVIWGGLNGIGILVYKYWRRISPWEKFDNRLTVFWKILLTFTFITFTRLYFRGESMEHISGWYNQVANNMDWGNALLVLNQYRIVFLVMLAGYVTHWLPVKAKLSIENIYSKSPFGLKVIYGVATGIICYQAYSASFQPFIYFQF
jgi:hypothetical protein